MTEEAFEDLAPPRKVRRLDRAVTALKLYRDGVSIRDIAKATGYQSVAGAWSAVQKALELEARPEAELARGLELQRLDWLTNTLTNQLRDPSNKKAIARLVEVYLKVMERRAQLLGIDLGEANRQSGEGVEGTKIVVYYRDDNQEARREQVKDILEGEIISSRIVDPVRPLGLPDSGDGGQD